VEEQLNTTSDADGKFVLPAMPPGLVCRLGISHSDYAYVELYTRTLDDPPAAYEGVPIARLPLELTLRSARTVPVVIVRADTGQPAADVGVAANERAGARRGSASNYAGGWSDKEGNLALK